MIWRRKETEHDKLNHIFNQIYKHTKDKPGSDNSSKGTATSSTINPDILSTTVQHNDPVLIYNQYRRMERELAQPNADE